MLDIHSAPPARDLKLEALLPVLSGEKPLIVSADRFDDINTALRNAGEFGISIILIRGAEADRVPHILAEEAVPVIWVPADAPYREFQASQGTAETPARLFAAGVLFAFQTGGIHNVDGLLEQARVAMASGLPREETLEALTLSPAQILGVADRYGSPVVGKSADLLV